jgi:hypothetical protein
MKQLLGTLILAWMLMAVLSEAVPNYGAQPPMTRLVHDLASCVRLR